jgi:hypothetical protein
VRRGTYAWVQERVGGQGRGGVDRHTFPSLSLTVCDMCLTSVSFSAYTFPSEMRFTRYLLCCLGVSMMNRMREGHGGKREWGPGGGGGGSRHSPKAASKNLGHKRRDREDAKDRGHWRERGTYTEP